jgi:uncharacterized repeat protein (TIGR03803 family)
MKPYKSSSMLHLLLLGAALLISIPALARAGVEHALFKFSFSANGFFPYGGLVSDGTNLYGTTSADDLSSDAGVVFEVVNGVGGLYPWTESVLYTFTGGGDGSTPYAGLVRDANGNLYGTTAYGGAQNSNCDGGCGTVFELSPPSQSGGSWTETTLYQFQGGNDGAHSQSTLILDSSGNLYGTTLDGGSVGVCCGTAFELSPPTTPGGTWTETVLHDFGSGNDGQEPEAGLHLGPQGELFGTTAAGGTQGSGTIFELTRSTGGWSEEVLYSFSGGADGGEPAAGVIEQNGVLYGTTVLGGPENAGTVFQLESVSGVFTETVLYGFQGESDGGYPYGGVIIDASGTLYGPAQYGGDTSKCVTKGSNGCGVIYQLSQSAGSWSETVLLTFDGSDGFAPHSNLLFTHDGLYFTTIHGGKPGCEFDCGGVFRLEL